MRQMFDARAEKPVINALFIQPTYWCSRNCKNCYVKAHIPAGPQVHPDEMNKLFWGFYKGTLGECNQITVSMDDMPIPGKPEYKWFRNFIEGLFAGRPVGTEDEHYHPEVHLTFRSIPSYREYERIWLSIASIASMITFSEIIEGELSWITNLKSKYPSLKINYNHMSPVYLTNGSWNNHLQWLDQLLRVVDSVYLVLEKTPLGVERDLLQVGIDRKRMWHNLKYFKRLKDDLVSNKLIVDGCIKDVVNFEHNGNGCSSNISRFQVWPDGSVSGCPYAIRGDTPPATTAEEIVQNIRRSREVYNFHQCHLTSTYRSLSAQEK